MTTPQPGIFAEPSSHHHYLEYVIDPGAGPERIGPAVAALVAGECPAAVNQVLAFGPALWADLAPHEMPADLANFQPLAGVDDYHIPATQRDLLVWLHGANLDDNLDRALAIQGALGAVATLELDQRGFTYHDSRDLTGFIDGTANPKDAGRQDAALIPEGQPGAGGAHVLSQLWQHDLAAFNAMPVAEQERIIGRTKADSIELEGDAMPTNSHVSRTDVTADGVAQKIYRRSAPFGGVGAHGLYFLAFACAPARFDVQLRRMFGVTEDGLHDRLIEFSKPVTSSYWFAPSVEVLATLV